MEPSYHPDLDRNRFVVMLADAVSSRTSVAVHLKEQAPRGVLVSKRDPNIYGTAGIPKPRHSLNCTSPLWTFSSAISLGCMRRSWRGGGHDPRTFDSPERINGMEWRCRSHDRLEVEVEPVPYAVAFAEPMGPEQMLDI